MRSLFFAVLFFLGCDQLAWAQDWQPSLWIEVVRVIGALILIIPLIYLAARFWKNQGGSGTGGRVVVLERTFLAQGKALYLVKVGEQVFLLGSAERGLTLLKEYQGPEAQALVESAQQAPTPEFQKILDGQLEKLKKMRTVFQKKEKGPRDE
jgi:flagellar biogenesis protein FliO